MNEEELRKQYADGTVNVYEVIKILIDRFKIDKTSVDIQQLQLVTEYLIYKIDNLQKENKELKKQLELKDKVIDNLYSDIEYEYSGTSYLKSLEEYYEEVKNE